MARMGANTKVRGGKTRELTCSGSMIGVGPSAQSLWSCGVATLHLRRSRGNESQGYRAMRQKACAPAPYLGVCRASLAHLLYRREQLDLTTEQAPRHDAPHRTVLSNRDLSPCLPIPLVPGVSSSRPQRNQTGRRGSCARRHPGPVLTAVPDARGGSFDDASCDLGPAPGSHTPIRGTRAHRDFPGTGCACTPAWRCP